MQVVSKDFKYQNLEHYLLDMINSGRFNVGEKLPSLRDVSQKMHVSLATVTHAYMELEKKGVIEARPRSGYYVRQKVAPLPIPDLPEHDVQIGKLSRTQLIQTVLGIVGEKGMLPFGCICADSSVLPHKALARIMNSVLRTHGQDVMSYESIQGNPLLRKQISWRMQEDDCRVTGNDVLITFGAMEALYLALRSTTRPGDNVVIQSPTYFCFLQLLENLGLRAIEVASCPTNGVSPRDLDRAFSRFDVAACILAPNFNNPDGALIPDATKQEIVTLCESNNIPLIEDDVSGDLYCDLEGRPRPLKSFDKIGNIIHCSSFSKTISPGFRVGYMIPGKKMDKALEIKATTNVSCSTPTQLAIGKYLEEGLYDRHLRKLRRRISDQRTHMQQYLPEYFPQGTRATQPKGGGVLWVELPKQIDGTKLFFDVKKHNISIAPGAIFSTSESFTNFIRLSCVGFWNDEMRAGLETIGRLAKEQLGSEY
ncbi:aminotransferase-like domain-containing protein [Halodesulfovibrio marinisediminis]|uniref:DNA-binding transcriptional regulator, MocR family, contains an aminotransferase domain n=1 Tax=Halodesulfovibrio marinisediminis DSM 17456 TaxID=1121457 RepID=A0A1N6GR08_9BACT|nr:PLP-dependent aminotransferase family protein [Halodesulfovibrio marinisediminis]SIO09971.1 DNA-binding transcriptional regulator, MocR family, contains an aminotransferase domain [Halodesulfovibrio marinisediminis DSM 17456]